MKSTHPSTSALPTALYAGVLHHARLSPFAHRFRYRLYLTGVDLDRWSEIEPTLRSVSTRIAGWRLRREDHLGAADQPLAICVRNRVRDETGATDLGRVVLLTHFQQFGYRFNPVSFYFCYSATDPLQLVAIVAEVNNTPWGEQHIYVLDCRAQQSPYSFELAKTFHVSPFLPLDMDYRFRFEIDDDSLRIRKENWRDGKQIFLADLDLTAEALNRESVARMLARFPFMTLRVIIAIYWQALRLFIKGARYYPHRNSVRNPPSVPKTSQPIA